MVDAFAAGKQAAATAAVNECVGDNMVVGVGSGSTIVFAVGRIKQRVEQEHLKLVCIPTSFQSKQLILDAGLVLGDLNQYPTLDVAIDGADECDLQLNCIKGGGGCQYGEKMVAFAAKKFVLIADDRKQQRVLGQTWKSGVPLEVCPEAYKLVMNALVKLGGKPVLRMCGGGKAGPVVSDYANFVVDCDFGEIANPQELNAKLIAIPGVVETGLFVNMAERAYFGTADGKSIRVDRK
ncbi:ribose 5-phosphate isomerase A [Batrachochytrium salamandrivorans]|nr:ribose 5-phosphate isomerase A [Batrachochytrium salamandrivorans]